MALIVAKPKNFLNAVKIGITDLVNERMLVLYSQLRQVTPLGVTEGLAQGWQITLFNNEDKDSTATITNNSDHFFPVERGRARGRGINAIGRVRVAKWAEEFLGLPPKKAQRFSYALSKVYMMRGRKAQGFAGLSRPGSLPRKEWNNKFVKGSVLDAAFRDIQYLLKSR